MFNFIDIGERAGSGIPNIFRVWKEEGLSTPSYMELMNPDRTILSLPLSPTEIGDKKIGDKKIGDKKSAISEKVKESIIVYLTDNPEGKTADIAEYIGLGRSRTRDYLKELLDEEIIVSNGNSNKTRTYSLKR